LDIETLEELTKEKFKGYSLKSNLDRLKQDNSEDNFKKYKEAFGEEFKLLQHLEINSNSYYWKLFSSRFYLISLSSFTFSASFFIYLKLNLFISFAKNHNNICSFLFYSSNASFKKLSFNWV